MEAYWQLGLNIALSWAGAPRVAISCPSLECPTLRCSEVNCPPVHGLTRDLIESIATSGCYWTAPSVLGVCVSSFGIGLIAGVVLVTYLSSRRGPKKSTLQDGSQATLGRPRPPSPGATGRPIRRLLSPG